MGFKQQFKKFNESFYNVRKTLDLETKVSLKEYEYDGKLGKNESIEKEVFEILTSNYRKVAFFAPTAAGKTYLFCNVFNKIKEEKDEYEKMGFVGKQYINVLFTPKKIQNQANQNEYENIKSIVANSKIELEDIENNVNFSIVYDKSEELENVCEIFCETLEREKNFYINLVIDEAHQLISSQYRRTCLLKLERLISLVHELGGNVIYTTASMNTCAALDFNEIIVCYPTKDENVGRIETITNNTEQKNKDFVYNNIVNVIKEGGIPCLRLNDKSLMKDLQKNIERLEESGYKVAILNSDNKENNEIYNTIINNSTLKRGYDCYIFTSILDEGTSITSMEDGTKPSNLVTMFYIDDKNANLDNYLQFNHRFRWARDLSICLVARHETQYEIESLETILKKEHMIFKCYYSSFKNFEIAKRWEVEKLFDDKNKVDYVVKSEVEKILNLEDSRGVCNHKNVFYYNNEIVFDKKAFFNRVYEEYMLQFFYCDASRNAYLKELFGCKVVDIKYNENDNTLKLVNYSTLEFNEFLEEVTKSEELQERIKKDEIEGEIKENENYTILTRLSEYVEIEKAANMMLDSIKKAKDNLKEYNRNDLKTFENDKTFLVFLKTSEMAGTFEDVEKIKRLVKSEFISLFTQGEKVGIDNNKMLDIVKTKNYNEVVNYIKEQAAINQNLLYLAMKAKGDAMDGLQKLPVGDVKNGEIIGMTPGAVGREHALLLYYIAKEKGECSKITLKSEQLEKIANLMSNELRVRYTRVAIEKMILLYFNCDVVTKKENKKTTKNIIVRTLKKTH